jgi:hypothetical protein
MVSLQATHPTTPDYHHKTYNDYPTGVVTNDASPISVTMKPEEEQPKAMSVQERIRALNKSTNDATKASARPVPGKQRAVSPWQVKAAVRSKSPPVRSELDEVSSCGESQSQASVDQRSAEAVGQSNETSGLKPIPDEELEGAADGAAVDERTNAVPDTGSSNSGEASLGKVEKLEGPQTSTNTLHQFMLDSARDESQLFDESEDGTDGEFDASAAVKYWRRNKGEPDSGDQTEKNEEVTDDSVLDINLDKTDESQVAVQDFEKSSTLSTCDETNEDLPSQRELNSEEGKSDLDQGVSAETDEHVGEMHQAAEQVPDLQIGNEEKAVPSRTQSEVKPPSPPVILRTVHSYPDMDAIEQSNESLVHVGVNPVEHENDALEDKPQRRESESDQSETKEDEVKEKQEKDKPMNTRSFSQRAFEKRSRRRAAQNAQTPASPKSKESTIEPAAEVESASVFSGSTTHSASTVHTTTLSSRATRLLREKRQGNVTKTDGLAKSLALNLLLGKSPTDTKLKNDMEPTPTRGKIDVKPEALPGATDNVGPIDEEGYSKVADNSNSAYDESNITQHLLAAVPPPTGMGDRRFSNPNMNHPVGYPMQRQASHGQYTNPIQFGPSPSFQNVEVGITTGPTVYQMQHTVPHYVHPVAGIPHGPYPNTDLRYTSNNRVAQISSDLLVQPKFSRYNSFDVQNPKPPPIQNVLTEDSASWSESRTQDDTTDGTVDGTQDDTQDSASGARCTPQESVGQESIGIESAGMDSNSVHPSIESISRLDSFPKGRSFDKGCTVFEHIQNACDALSPRSCNPEIVSNPTIQSNDLIHVGSTFSNTLSDEDVAIEVEYVARSREERQEADIEDSEEDADFEDADHAEEQIDTSSESSIYSLSTRDMDSKDSYSMDNV